MIFGNWTFFDWLGWTNINTCLASYFNSQGAGENRNLGVTILPLQFWRYVGFWKSDCGADNNRYWIGLGFIEIFWDRPS